MDHGTGRWTLAIRCPVSVEEHIKATFKGLPVQYDPFIAFVNTRLEPYSVSEIEALLITQEVHFDKHTKYVNVGNKNSMNIATSEVKEKSSNDKANKNSGCIRGGN